ncbi:nitrate reductase associated protein [Dyadobacter luticola]|uniref:Nitrate reductase associated protein n=1 Tax=Dyadobacter luticola TaxID=1979387 RepID=A0A5R9L373_9BACT|nr:nitrate reductase associated protein [Dyadobacter luticola]TLV02710.1 hypothetical protein FEN17_03570 [Dyadobacter luticola]
MIAENLKLENPQTEKVDVKFFQFENDFVGTLKCVPMIVRYKLDACRVKLKLADWVKLSYAEKDDLAQMPCYLDFEVENYGRYVRELVWKYTGVYPSILLDLNDMWSQANLVPEEVNEKAAEWECAEITIRQWAALDFLERFALVKLSRSGHEGKNFPAAVREFF